MEKLDNDNNYFKRLSVGVIGYMLEFFSSKEISTFFKINKKFSKALNNERIWQNYILFNKLFVLGERNLFTTWKDYYRFIIHQKFPITLTGHSIVVSQ